MTQNKLDRWVIVFDLDDTLYKEQDFVRSGLRFVADTVRNLYGLDVTSDLLRWLHSGEKDILGRICSIMGLPNSAKESLLWLYRLHTPQIKLEARVSQLLARLSSQGAILAVLTDGRAITQRNKLAALGLQNLPAFISEESGTVKPDTARFMEIMRRYNRSRYVYVADNPQKDFVGPNALGWLTLGLRDDGRNIHDQSRELMDETANPAHWLDTLEDLEKFLC